MSIPHTSPRFSLSAHGWSPDWGAGFRKLTIENGRIVAVEMALDNADLDLRDAFVIPGLIDSHLHLSLGAKMLSQLDLSPAKSREDFERLIARRHAELPKGSWLLAHGWSEQNWPENALPDHSWLAVTGDRPVVCYRMDHHSCLVNAAVLQRLPLDHHPVGGRIERDSHGNPTGLLVEAAAWKLVNPIIPEPSLPERISARAEPSLI